MTEDHRNAVKDAVAVLIAGADRVTGPPLDTFTVLATHILVNLAGYRHRALLMTFGPNDVTQPDVDYLARMLQSTYGSLQDYQGEVI